jgi:4-hydroxymandelate oxidase
LPIFYKHLIKNTPTHIPLPNLQDGDHPVFNGLTKIAPQWQDIAFIVQNTKQSVLLKSIVHPIWCDF